MIERGTHDCGWRRASAAPENSDDDIVLWEGYPGCIPLASRKQQQRETDALRPWHEAGEYPKRVVHTTRFPQNSGTEQYPGGVDVIHCRTLLAVALVSFIAMLPVNAQERTGFEIHGGIGASQIKDRDGSDTFDGSGFGYTFGIEYRFVPRFALGVDLFSLGSANDTIDSVDTEIEADGIDLFARLIFPLSDAVEVYGRVGGTIYNADVVPGLSSGPFGEEATTFGAGLDIGRDKLTFRLEGRYIDGRRDESGALLTAGFSYRF